MREEERKSMRGRWQRTGTADSRISVRHSRGAGRCGGAHFQLRVGLPVTDGLELGGDFDALAVRVWPCNVANSNVDSVAPGLEHLGPRNLFLVCSTPCPLSTCRAESFV